LLAARGFDVFGIERSEAMAAAGHQPGGSAGESAGGKFDCVQGDIRTSTVGRVFDAVISLFHVVSYQTTNDDLILAFANAARHLRPGGVFLFDVWHGPAVMAERPAVRVKRMEDDRTRLIRIAEPEVDVQASVVTVHYTMLAASKVDHSLTTFEEEHHMRYFFPVEIDLLATHTGFDVERTEEFLTGSPVLERTFGVAYMLRKRR
jgi:SAM-dependent methyltransferase